MAKRFICGRDKCIVCLSIGPHNLSTLQTTFMRGYIAGMHRVSKGDLAHEHVCEEHARALDEAMAFYVGDGVDFNTTPIRLQGIHPVEMPEGIRGRPRKVGF